MEEVASVSVGERHTCAMKQDNSPLCWGDNWLGQIGDGTNIQRVSPYPVKISDIVISVSSGDEHTCALMSDRSLWCWGNNSYGQLGSPSRNYCGVGSSPNCNKNPTKIMDDVVQFSAGGYHTCAIKTDGSLWCWGANWYGQLGDGTYTNRETPVQIMSSGVSSVALGTYHTCAIKTDGSLWCWGANWYGQLGVGDGTYANRDTPVQIMSSGVSSVALGTYHTCAIKTDGSLWCWGANWYGQLGVGDGTYTNRDTPVQIMSSGVSSVALGYYHTCAIKIDGSLWCWGYNYYGQLGVGDGTYTNRDTPVQIMSSGVSSVALWGFHTCAIKTDGSLWCWGRNYYGQLGDGTYTNRDTPVQIMSSGVSSVALGYYHTCAIKQDGSLWCWGDNEYGQLGNGTQLQKTTPYPVITPAGALSISVGRNHSCAIKTDGSLWCWGYNSSGQLGNGESAGDSSYLPSQVSPPILSDVSFVSLGGEHSCAIKIDGSLWCWGDNYYGQLGDGTYGPYADKNTPVKIMSSGVSSVALGLYHTCAIKTDGSLWCWGANWYGQVGVGPEGDVYYSPVTVMQDVLTVSAGYYHTCAIKIDGTLWCWGYNYYGQVDGNGTFDTNEAFARKVTFSYSSPAPRLNFIYKDNNNKLSGLRDTNEISQPYSCLSFGVRAFDVVLIMVVIYFFAKRRSLLKLVNLKNERKIRIKERR
jgi:alpha-tubulin suppressor-like RCC1 family protein